MCRDCGTTGHIRNMCPLQTSGGDDASAKRPRDDTDVNLRCGLCSKAGHRAETCSEYKCHDCGILGHMSRNCPKKYADVKCFFCRKKGHTISACEFKKRYPNDDQLCYLCLRPGHHASECSNAAVCHSCEGTGHIASECPQLECHKCHDKGHFERNCPDTMCYNCGGKGHQSSICEVTPPRTLPDVPTTPIPENGRVALIVDGEYFTRALCGESPDYAFITKALQHVSRLVAEVFQMQVMGSWYCVDQSKTIEFLEESKVAEGPIADLRKANAARAEGLLANMSPNGPLRNFTACEAGCVSMGRYLTQDGVFSTAIQGGVNVAIALQVINSCCSPHINQVVLLTGTDALSMALSPRNTRRPGMPPVRLCCVRLRDDSDFTPFLRDYPPLRLDTAVHDEGFRSVPFPAYTAFVQEA